MKSRTYLVASLVVIAACNNSTQVANEKALAAKDSTLLAESQKKDSVISVYVDAMNQIQDNLDSIKSKEKILTVNQSGEPLGKGVVSDVKSLDRLILKNNRKIYHLELKLRKMDKKDAGLEKMLAHLTKELAEKNTEIAVLQEKLSSANESLRSLTVQFNDSVMVINRQRSEINAMRTEVNTVYYAFGTVKELQNKRLIDKKGGLLGIGRTAELNPEASNSKFIKADMTTLHAIVLDGKFGKLVTAHPANSYRVSANADTLVITDPASFWSENKYLVISVK